MRLKARRGPIHWSHEFTSRVLVQWHRKNNVTCDTSIVPRLLRLLSQAQLSGGHLACQIQWRLEGVRLLNKFTIRKDDGLTEPPPFDKIRPGDSSFAEDRYHQCGLCALKDLHIELEGASVSELQKSCYDGTIQYQDDSETSLVWDFEQSQPAETPTIMWPAQSIYTRPNPNISNIWQDVVDLMHSAYTSKVAISGIASLEFRGLALYLWF